MHRFAPRSIRHRACGAAPDPALVAYLTVIREEPDAVLRALDAA
jgi:hypothetical protein